MKQCFTSLRRSSFIHLRACDKWPAMAVLLLPFCLTLGVVFGMILSLWIGLKDGAQR